MASVWNEIRAKVKIFDGHELVLACDLRSVLTSGRSNFVTGTRNNPELIIKHRLAEGVDFFWVKVEDDGSLSPTSSKSKNPMRKMGLRLAYLYANMTVTSDEDVASTSLPPLVDLSDEEKFRDSDGNVVEIEVRGVKTLNGIYFHANKTGELLGVDKVGSWIGKERSSYIEGTHYRKFRSPGGGFVNMLTFLGLLHMFFNSTRPVAINYCMWVATVIFTAQLGSREEKVQLTSRMLGVPISIVRQFTSSEISGGLSGIYLFKVGTVAELRKSWNLPADWDDDWVICKYGRTILLDRRSGEHQLKFDKILGKRGRQKEASSSRSRSRSLSPRPRTSSSPDLCAEEDDTLTVKYIIADEQLVEDLDKLEKFPDVKEIRLLYFAQIDASYQITAEDQLRAYFEKNEQKVEFRGMRELVMLSKDGIVKAKGHYDQVKRKYAGCLAQFQTDLLDLKARCQGLEEMKSMNEATIKDLRDQIATFVANYATLLEERKAERERWDAERKEERERWDAERSRLQGIINEKELQMAEMAKEHKEVVRQKDLQMAEMAREHKEVVKAKDRRIEEVEKYSREERREMLSMIKGNQSQSRPVP